MSRAPRLLGGAAVALLLACAPLAQAAKKPAMPATLEQRLSALLRRGPVRRSEMGVVVTRLGDPAPLASLNAEQAVRSRVHDEALHDRRGAGPARPRLQVPDAPVPRRRDRRGRRPSGAPRGDGRGRSGALRPLVRGRPARGLPALGGVAPRTRGSARSATVFSSTCRSSTTSSRIPTGRASRSSAGIRRPCRPCRTTTTSSSCAPREASGPAARRCWASTRSARRS